MRRESGRVWDVARNDTADIVIIELMKKYEAISTIDENDIGTMTLKMKLRRGMPRVAPTSSRLLLILLKALLAIRYGEEKK